MRNNRAVVLPPEQLPGSPLLTQGICDDHVFRIVCELCGATDRSVHGALPPHVHHPNAQLDIEAAEDPDQRPYVWDLPEENCTCH